MTFVAAQILVWILVATFFGFVLGWVTNSRRQSSAKRKKKTGPRRF